MQLPGRTAPTAGFRLPAGFRQGSCGYQSYVDGGQYQYYFQQGFQRGYQDGYNTRTQYDYRQGGSMNILGTILGSILNIREF
ncbi:MAG: hypothetical protein ABL984_10860 [Pyrinomonadaceae bacterium]